jgi:hypothetical protein
MLGIVVGVICLLALVRVARGRRHWDRRGRRHFLLRGIFRRLNTGPGQEKVVLGEVASMRETLRGLRAELKTTRADIAAIVRDPHFDRAKLEALFRQQDALLAKLRDAASGSLERVHEALDDRQKSELADMLERGFHRYAYGC